MSAPEAVATTTPPVEAQPVEPIPAPTAEIHKDEEPVAVATEPQQEAQTEETPVSVEPVAVPIEDEVAPVALEEPVKEEVKPVKSETQKEERPKSPNAFIKFFASIKDKAKGSPKSPKKEKKESEADAPVAEDSPKEEVLTAEPTVATPKAEDALVADPVKGTEAITAVPATAEAAGVKKRDERKEDGISKPKKRLSSFIPNFRSKSKSEALTPAKVDENPPKIEEPTPVAPLTHPTSAPAAEAKPQDATTDTTPAAPVNPVVAAAA